MPTLAEIIDATARPLPDEIADQETSVQGLRVAPGTPDTLYALDSGVRALSSNDPSRAALVVIDVTGTTAYLVDAGGEEPHGLIVLDLRTGHARRVLHDHPTIRAAASRARRHPVGWRAAHRARPRRWIHTGEDRCDRHHPGRA